MQSDVNPSVSFISFAMYKNSRMNQFTIAIFILIFTACQAMGDDSWTCILESELCPNLQISAGQHSFGMVDDLWTFNSKTATQQQTKFDDQPALLLSSEPGADIELIWNLSGEPLKKFKQREICIEMEMYAFSRSHFPIYFQTRANFFHVQKTHQTEEWTQVTISSISRDASLKLTTRTSRLAIRNVKFVDAQCESNRIDCDFENSGVCGFDHALQYSDHLQISNCQSSQEKKPKHDATSLTEYGHFLNVREWDQWSHKKDVLRNHVVLEATTKAGSQPVWYEMTWMVNIMEDDLDKLDELDHIVWQLEDKSDNNKLINLFDSEHEPLSLRAKPYWQKIRHVFAINKKHILTMIHKSNRKRIYVDDIQVRKLDQDRQWFCTFNEGFCQFQPCWPGQSNSFVIGRGRLHQPTAFPSRMMQRLLTENPNRFLYVDFTESDEPKAKETNGSLKRKVKMETPFLQVVHLFDFCMEISIVSLFARSSINTSPHLSVWLVHENDHHQSLLRLDQSTNEWTESRITFYTDQSFRIVIEADNGDERNSPAFFALRNFRLKEQVCVEQQHLRQGLIEDLSCVFGLIENRLCGWRNVGVQPWKFSPNESKEENFIVLANSAELSTSGHLRSPKFFERNSNVVYNYCLRIQYQAHLYPGTGHFEVKLNDNQLLFESTDTRFDRDWVTRQIDFTAMNDFFLSLKGQLDQGQIRVKEIEIQHGSCKRNAKNDQFACNFEIDDCQIEVLENEFKLMKASELKYQTTVDHTLEQAEGHLLALEVFSEQKLGANVWFKLPPVIIEHETCLRFWLNVNSLADVRIWDGNATEPIFERKQMRPKNEWFGYEIQLSPHLDEQTRLKPRYLDFEIKTTKSDDGFLAFDDIFTYPGQCEGHLCTFETFPCLWQKFVGSLEYQTRDNQKQTIEIKNGWKVVNAHNVAPYKDHTTKTSTGSVLLHDQINVASAFASPRITINQQDSSFCLQFHFYVSNELESGVSVLYESESSSLIMELLYETLTLPKVAEKNDWHQMQFTIKPQQLASMSKSSTSSRSFVVYLLLHPHLGNSFLLDDFAILPGACLESKKYFSCSQISDVKKIPINHVCDQVLDCLNGEDEKHCGSCSFGSDDETCGYELKDEVEAKWNVIEAKKVNELVLPNEWKSVWSIVLQPVQMAKVTKISPIIRKTYSKCRLEVKMISQAPQLTVLLAAIDSFEQVEVWKSDDKFNEIIVTSIPLANLDIDFQLIFLIDYSDKMKSKLISSKTSKKIQSNPKTLIIHEIRMKNCGVEDILMNFEEKKEEMFKCANGFLIPLKRKCDLKFDCDDKSDELECQFDKYRTNFEGENIPFKIGGHFKTVQTKTQLSQGPTYDRSSQYLTGTYLMLQNAVDLESSSEGLTGRILGIELHNHQKCRMRFAYQQQGKYIRLVIKWISMNLPSKQGRIPIDLDSESQEWTMKIVSFDPDTIGHVLSLRIRAHLSRGDEFLALDDFSFTQECYANDLHAASCDFSRTGSSCLWKEDSIVDNTMRVQPLARLPSESAFCTGQSLNLEVQPFYGMSLAPHESCDKLNERLQDEPECNDIRRWTSRLISVQMASHKSGYLVLKLDSLVFGSSFKSFKVSELESRTTLMERQSSSLTPIPQTSYISMKVNIGQSLRFALEGQLAGPQTYVHLQSISILDEDSANNGDKSADGCTFDYKTSCDLFGNSLSDFNQFRYSIQSTISLSDHTLGTSTGGFLYASSQDSKVIRQSILFNSKKPQICLSFWYTSSVLGSKNSKINQIPELSLLDPFEISKTLFHSQVNLQGRWRFVRILIDNSISKRWQFQVKFGTGNQESDQILALDDVKTSSVENCQSISCSFSQTQSCGWHNEESHEQRNWIFLDKDTCNAEHLPICTSWPDPDQLLAFVHFHPEDVRRKAILVSDVISSDFSTESHCVEIKYATSGRKEIELIVQTNDQTTNRVWNRLSNDEKNTWKIVFIDLELTSSTGSQELRLEADLLQFSNSTEWHFIALQFVRLHSKSCSKVVQSGDNLDDSAESIVNPKFISSKLINLPIDKIPSWWKPLICFLSIIVILLIGFLVIFKYRKSIFLSPPC